MTGEARESTWPLPSKAGGESKNSRLPETQTLTSGGEMLLLWPVPRLLDLIIVTKSETCAIQAAAHRSVAVVRLLTHCPYFNGTGPYSRLRTQRANHTWPSDCVGCATQEALTDQVSEQNHTCVGAHAAEPGSSI